MPSETANDFPWEKDRRGAEPPLLRTPHEAPNRLAGKYNREIYSDTLARLPSGKAAGPDEVPNEVLKWMPVAFHDMLHEYFRLLWAHGYTPH